MHGFESDIQELARLEQSKQDVLERIASKLRSEFPRVAPLLEAYGGKEGMVCEFLYATLKDPAANAEITDLEYARKYGEDALWTEIGDIVCPSYQ